jgi:predicted transporter
VLCEGFVLDVDDGVACHVCLGAVWVSMQTVEVGAYVVALCDVFWCLWFIAVSHFSVLDDRQGWVRGYASTSGISGSANRLLISALSLFGALPILFLVFHLYWYEWFYIRLYMSKYKLLVPGLEHLSINSQVGIIELLSWLTRICCFLPLRRRKQCEINDH